MEGNEAAAGGWVLAAGLFAASAGYDIGATGGLTNSGAVWLGLAGMAVAMAGMYSQQADIECAGTRLLRRR